MPSRRERRAAARSNKQPVRRGAHWAPGAAGPEESLPEQLRSEQARIRQIEATTRGKGLPALVTARDSVATRPAVVATKTGRSLLLPAAVGAGVLGVGAYALHRRRNRVISKSAPDRVYGFSTPAIGQTRSVSPIRPHARANTYGSAMKDSVKLRSRRGNRDALGRFAGPKNKGHGSRLKEVHKSVSPMFGAKDAFADQPTRQVKALTPTGKHVGTANNYKKHSRLDGYSGMPRGKNASHLGHYKKGRDRAAGEFTGKKKVVTKAMPKGVDMASRMGGHINRTTGTSAVRRNLSGAEPKSLLTQRLAAKKNVKKSEFGRVGKRLDDWVVR